VSGDGATRARLLGALVAGPMLAVVTLIAGTATAGYDPWANTISRLASPRQPFALPVALSFVLYGLLVLWAATPLASAFSSSGRTASALLSLYGAAGVVCGLAPKDLPGVATTPASRVHVAATIVGGVAVLGCMALAVAQEPSGAWRRTTLALFLATIVAAVTFRQAWGTSIYGALERVVLGVPMLWVTALAARALDGIARRNTGVELTRG
jgi:Protein of unknown function (DUF998)